MADPNTSTKSPRLDPQNITNPNKFYTQFLYKSIIVFVFLVILPFFHSQAPEFISQTLHNRSWEFLQLIFVGIAVSYGLFSKKNEELDKDYSQGSKFDNAQSYVSGLLHVASVFDDEIENSTGCDDNSKVHQTWSSQYYRNEPIVVVEKGSPVLEKPLFLPVRSLKLDDSIIRPSSRLGSNNFPGKIMDLEGKGEENVVLRSPIPWKSRSGRMELKGDGNEPPLMEDSDINRLDSLSIKSQFSQSSRSSSSLSSSSSSSPKNLSPRHSFSSEIRDKKVEDLVRKKSFHRSPPPPPPPPPPPTPPLVSKSSYGGKYRGNFPGKLRETGDFLGGENLRAEWGSISMERRGDNFHPVSKQTSSVFSKEEKKEFVEDNKDSDSEEDDDEDDDEFEEKQENEMTSANTITDGGPDVDKKADEFIAKFREQIRLQRIASIRKSTAQIPPRNSVR